MFEDRADAGFKLCPKLKKFSDRKNIFVVGLTRGGVLTAKAITSCLSLKLFPLIVKKIPAPGNEELAIGAITSVKDVFLNSLLIKRLNIPKEEIENLVKQKKQEIKKLSQKLKTDYNILKNGDVILVDDGVATGASVIASREFLKKTGVKKIILATPVIAEDTLSEIMKYFDDVIYLIKERDFYSVGQFYKNFGQISDEEVARILNI